MRGFIVVALVCITIGAALSQCDEKIKSCTTGPNYEHECTTE